MKKPIKVLIIFLLLILASFVWWQNGSSAANPSDKKEYTFVVSKGEGVRSIGNRLKQANLIKDPIVFFLTVKNIPLIGLGLDDKIQYGDHRVSPSMNAREVARSLTLATNDIWITVQEGLRADEIVDILKKDLKTYKESWREDLNDNEGYLFPDTYLVPKDASVEQILSIFKNNFDAKYSTIENLEKSKLDKSEIVTIASLVEREARLSEDRPLVASVILNRLRIGMKLDIDATVQYVLGYQRGEKDWWKSALTFEDLDIRSPYNTYRNAGLTPTPISNPGLAAMNAVVNAPDTDYLYYLTDNKTGKNHYAETIEEHNENKEKFGL